MVVDHLAAAGHRARQETPALCGRGVLIPSGGPRATKAAPTQAASPAPQPSAIGHVVSACIAAPPAATSATIRQLTAGRRRTSSNMRAPRARMPVLVGPSGSSTSSRGSRASRTVELALHEACVNALDHAGRGDACDIELVIAQGVCDTASSMLDSDSIPTPSVRRCPPRARRTVGGGAHACGHGPLGAGPRNCRTSGQAPRLRRPVDSTVDVAVATTTKMQRGGRLTRAGTECTRKRALRCARVQSEGSSLSASGRREVAGSPRVVRERRVRLPRRVTRPKSLLRTRPPVS